MKKIRFISLLAVLFACLAGSQAWATTLFSVTSENFGDYTTFTITRSGDNLPAQTVKYRTVSLSAVAGQHFQETTGELSFVANETTKTVNVTEQAPKEQYRFQEGTSREYRFEVLDVNGFELTHTDHSITLSSEMQVHQSGLYSSHTYNITGDGEITVEDDGYGQAYHEVPMSKFFHATAPQEYLMAIDSHLNLDITMKVREVDDGYQYIQLLVDETEKYDKCKGGGNPGKLEHSIYLCGFGHKPGSKYTDWEIYAFPHQWQGSDCPEDFPAWDDGPYYNYYGKLYTQRYNTLLWDYNTRRLLIPKNASSVGIRFDASGDWGDTWKAKEVKVRLQAFDDHCPYCNTSEEKVSAGPYNKGNTVTITIPFSEVVRITSTTCVLNTTWGSLNYVSGSGTNVITFRGTISANAGTVLEITGFTGEIRDLAGKLYPFSLAKTFPADPYTSTESYISTDVSTIFSDFDDINGTVNKNAELSERYPKLVDGDNNTQWCTYGLPASIDFSYPTTIVPKGYFLTTGSDISKHPNRNPKSWMLMGKVNFLDPWTLLDTRTDCDDLPATDKTHQMFTIANTTNAYKYFRFMVTAVGENESDGKDWMELSELRMYGIIDANYDSNLTNATFHGLSEYYQHTGSPIDISYTVTSATGKTLTKDKDYTETISYETISPVTVKYAGNYTLTITGIGDYYGSKQYNFSVVNMIPVTEETTTWGDGNVYKVSGNVTISERITISGTVTLNLLEGCTLNANEGIEVSTGETLIINGPGALVTNVSYSNHLCAVIGGSYLANLDDCGTVIINGGQINIGQTGNCGIGRALNGNISGSVTLGWTDDTDKITTTFDVESINFADGKEFILAEQGMIATPENLTGNCTLIPTTETNVHNIAYAAISGIHDKYYYTSQDINLDYTVTDIQGNAATYTPALTFNDAATASVNAIGKYTLTLTGTGDYTGTKTVQFEVVANPKPTGVYQTGYSEESATIAWTENGDATSWTLQYSTVEDFATNTEVAVSGTPSYTITDLTPEAMYYVRIKAINGTAESDWSETVRVYPTAKKWLGIGTSEANLSLPIYTGNYKSHTQQLYMAEELEGARTITGLDFRSTEDSENHTLTIYMVHTDKAKMASDNDWIALSNEDKVFEGEVQILNNLWTTVTFDTPFVYDGVHNVALIFDEKASTYHKRLKFSTYNATENCSLAYNSSYDFTTFLEHGTLYSSKNEIRFSTLPYVTLANDADNSSVISANNDQTRDVHLADRVLYKDGKWNTLCLPFDLTIAGSPLAEATVMELNSASLSGGTLTLNFKEETTKMTAGKPYIVRWNDIADDLVGPTFTGVTFNNSVNNVDFTTVQLIGSFSPVILDVNDKTKLFLGADNNLFYPNAANNIDGKYHIGACRAYFSLDPNATVKEFKLNFDEEDATSIDSLTPALSKGEGDIYNLAGQRLSKMQRGINIVNGKKVLK